MEMIVETLQKRAQTAGLQIDQQHVFELLDAAWCPFCCRDGARGGNENCGPKLELAT
jgi:hypothetical protein